MELEEREAAERPRGLSEMQPAADVTSVLVRWDGKHAQAEICSDGQRGVFAGRFLEEDFFFLKCNHHMLQVM